MRIAKFSFLLGFLTFLFTCTDPENPFDITDPDYQRTTFDIVVDSTGTIRDTIVLTTDDTLKIGIQSNYLMRVDSIRVDFDLKSITDSLKIIKSEDVMSGSNLNVAYLSAPKVFDEVKTYMVEVFLYTLNGDNAADTIYVVVNGAAPWILTQPKDTTVEETDTASFTVAAGGTKDLSYQWFKRDSEVELSVSNSSIYKDFFVEMEDSGLYYCVVTNSYGSDTSEPAMLAVLPQKIDPNSPYVSFLNDTLKFSEAVKAVVPVVLSKPAEKEVRVGINFLASSSAKPDSDYVITARDVIFPVNAKSANLTIDIIDDNVGETTEELILQIGTIRNAQPAEDKQQLHYIITDDDVADSTWPELYFVTESGDGSEGQNVVIPIALETKNNWEREVKVRVKVLSGDPEDYMFTDTVVTFAVNEKQKNITLQIPKDQISENDEVIELGLENPSNAVLSKTQPTVFQYTIKDVNSCVVNFESLEMTGPEKDTTPTYDSIKVVLSTPNVNEVTVQYAIDSSISTATNQGVDYLLTGDGMLKFPPNVQTAWIPIVITGDNLAEGEEIIGIKLLNPTGGAALAPSAPSFRYIIGDNEIVSLSFRKALTTITESDGDFNIGVFLSGEVTDTIKVDYRISGTAQGTDADYQFKSGESGLKTLTFTPGQTESAIEMVVFNDRYNEPEESFVLKLENVRGNALLGLIDTHKVVIQDDDSPFYTFDKASASISEGIGTYNIPVMVSNPSQFQVRMLCVIDPIATTAQAADYTLPLSDTIIIKANDTVAYFPLTIVDDVVDENEQFVAFRLLQVENDAAPGAITSITLTISDNDSAPVVAFLKDSLYVGEADGQLLLPVLVNGQSEKSMNVSFRTGQLSAGCDSLDFVVAGSGILDFASGAQQNVLVTIQNDQIPDEELDNFSIDLYNPENLVLGTIKSEMVTIRDNDFQITISSTGDSGIVQPAGFSIVQRGDSLQTIAKPFDHYHLVSWTATNSLAISDATSDTITIRNIQSSGTVTALFALDTHEVVISSNELGTIEPSGTVMAGWGKTILPGTLAPLSGYHFSHWTLTGAITATSGVTNPTTTFTVSGDGTIKAEFAIDDHALLINSNNAAMGTVSPERIEITFGGDTTITATPNAHAHFLIWDAPAGLLASIEDVTSPTTRVNDISVTGTIIANFGWDSSEITISSSDAAIGAVDPAGTLIKSYVDTVILNATPVTGYRFTTWEITSGTGNAVIDVPTSQTTVLRTVSDDIILQGNFAVNKYKIQLQYPDSGGTAITTNPALTADSMLDYGSQLILIANPNPGWELDHWVGGAADGHTKNPDTIAVGIDNQFKPVFKRKTYTLSATAISTEGTVSGLSPVSFLHGVKTRFSATVTPINTAEYQFSNSWYPVSGSPNVSAGGDSITMTADAEIRAIFIKRSYPVELIQPASGGGTISSTPKNETMVEYGSNITLTATADPGYHFKNWSGGTANGQNTNPITVQGSSVNQFTAVFELNTYTLKFQANAKAGSLDKDSLTGFSHGVGKTFNVTVTNVKPDSCVFNNTWAVVDGTVSVNGNTATLSSTSTIQPNFTVQQYPLKMTAASGGTMTSSPDTGHSYNYGRSYTLTATPVTGYHFVSWTGGNAQGSTANPLTTTISTSNNISAVFEPDRYTLTLNQPSNGGTISASVAPGSDGKYPYGQQVTLTVNLVSGWRFSSWVGATGDNPKTITITQNQNIGADVAPIAVPVNVICVKKGAPHNGGGALGSNWVDAYTSIHDALATATSGDAVWVAQDSFVVSTYDASVTYKLNAGVSLYGGFTGTESQLSGRDWINNRTILSGACGTGKSDTIFVAQANSVIDGFRITNGGKYGGYLRGGCKIRNCLFLNNSTKTAAGGTALMVYSSGSEISSCVFAGNVGTNGSALLLCTNTSNSIIANCVIANNRGPAIYSNATSATLIKSSVVNNANPTSNSNNPGGIKNTGTIRLESSILWGNTNLSNPQASTQINTTQYVTYCCIQDCNVDGLGVGSKTAGQWQSTNIDQTPSFLNTTIPTDDRSWYRLTSNTIPPFVPGNSSGCLNKSYVSISTFGNDIRGMARVIPYEIGAYEQYE